MMDNMIVQVDDYTAYTDITATVAPSNVVLQGGSDIYYVSSLCTLSDQAGATITLANDDKATLDKLLADGVKTAVIIDNYGSLSVRYQYIGIGALIIVFLAANGKGSTYIVGYQYRDNVCRCIIKYKLADIGDSDTMLTVDNWQQYITLPSEWVKTEDMADVNLYNAKELYILFKVSGDDTYPLYIVCPDGLGAHINQWYYVANYFNTTSDCNAAYYNGTQLNLSGTYSASEVWYKL